MGRHGLITNGHISDIYCPFPYYAHGHAVRQAGRQAGHADCRVTFRVFSEAGDTAHNMTTSMLHCSL